MIGIIFDMDGTLLDTQRIYVDAWDFLGAEYNIENLGRHVAPCCGMNQEAWQNYLRKHFPIIDIERFTLEVKEFVTEHLVVRYKKGAKELIAFLQEKRIPFAIASGTSRKIIHHYLAELGDTNLFETIVGGDEIEKSKPAPDIFLEAARRLGLAPEDCIVLEDSSNGMRAGIAAGMRCIAVPDIAPIDEDVRPKLTGIADDLGKVIDLITPYV